MADFIPPAQKRASPFADMRGHHVAVRTPDLETAKRWYVDKLDFRVVAEWDYGDEKLAYLASATVSMWRSSAAASLLRKRCAPIPTSAIA
jgi:glyoxylase I family protein